MAKKNLTTLESFDEVDEALLKLAEYKAFVQHEEAILNDGLQKTREEFDQKVATQRERAATIESNIEGFCIQHKDEFERTRSKELTHGIVSFRTTPPKVAFLNRKYGYSTVIELIKRLGFQKKYLRVKEEVDKEAILADSAAKQLSDEKLAACGLKIDQTEQFDITIKWDSIKD